MKKIITFGTFDLFHIGHVRMLKRAKELGDYLIVGVSTDQLNYKKKERNPIYNEKSRMEIVGSMACVDEVFAEESLEKKREYILKHGADVFVIGDDWSGKFDDLKDICQVIYLPRTPCISTTEIIEVVKDI